MNFTTHDIHTNIEESVLDILKYFSIFKFPLHVWEIYKYMNFKCSQIELQLILDKMVENKTIFIINSCYSLNQNENEIIDKENGYKRAIEQLEKAKRYSRFIYRFPFVKMVAISGSLSKNYSSINGDIDYFIITDSNRLWITRTLLHLFKKLTFILGMQHNFCMNYFIDLSALSIAEKNKFTAIELRSLIYMKGGKIYQEFQNNNQWINQFTPNTPFESSEDKIPIKTDRNKALQKINIWLMKLTDIKWRNKWKKKKYDMKQYDLAFKTTVSVSKNHNKNFQKKVLDEYKD